RRAPGFRLSPSAPARPVAPLRPPAGRVAISPGGSHAQPARPHLRGRGGHRRRPPPLLRPEL
ncbi:MAG: hypothetical protein AVDCRST_MAG59-3309, partial [uncultured Thermomicrobiales bacterium]